MKSASPTGPVGRGAGGGKGTGGRAAPHAIARNKLPAMVTIPIRAVGNIPRYKAKSRTRLQDFPPEINFGTREAREGIGLCHIALVQRDPNGFEPELSLQRISGGSCWIQRTSRFPRKTLHFDRTVL